MLHVHDLTIARGGVPILAGLGFDLAAGQALVLRGPNGAGKTTLLRTLAGLQPPVSGTITGADETLAYAAHSDGLKSMLSVTENLRFWADVFGRGTDIETALTAFELTDLRHRRAGTLSAGQKRRLGLARLLVTGRPIWALDEPTVSLDTHAVGLFATAVQAHLAEGGAAIIATHIDLGLSNPQVLDVAQFRAKALDVPSADAAFL